MVGDLVMFGLRVLLLLGWFAGCASQRLIVPDEDWQTVPAAQRTSVDRRHETELAAARAELATATEDLAAFRRSHPGPPAPVARPAPAPAPPLARDEDSALEREHERARSAALARVEADQAAWLRASFAWRELRVEAASARLEVVICERELLRARTIDRNLLGTDTYDSAPLRGQFSRAQQRWYAVSSRASQARVAFERASASVASSKEAYAQRMRGGATELPPAVDDRAARLELTSWAVVRSDIRRRRGLRNFLDTVATTPPTLRKAKLRLAARAVVLPPAAAPSATNPTSDTSAAKPAPTTVTVAAKPAPAPSAAAATATAKPAAAAAKPSTATATATAKPSTAAAKPPAAAATPSTAAATPSTATAKPSTATATLSTAKPAPAAAKPRPAPATATAAPLPPTPRKPTPAAPAPLFSAPPPTSAAKPAEPEPPR